MPDNKKKKNDKNGVLEKPMNRRDFFKTCGKAALAIGGTLLVGSTLMTHCGSSTDSDNGGGNDY